MQDNENPIKPLIKINFFGKEGTKHPFQLSRFKRVGLFYYVFAKDLQQLLHINKKYESTKKPEHGTEPLQEVFLVGAGNIAGYKPFIYRGEPSVCILADHLHQLMKINKEYRKMKKGIQKEHKPEKAVKEHTPEKAIEENLIEKVEKPKELPKLAGERLKITKKVKLRKKKVREKIIKSKAEHVKPKKKIAKKAEKSKASKTIKRRVESKKPKEIKKAKISKRKAWKKIVKFKVKPKKKIAKKAEKPKPKKIVKRKKHAKIAKSKKGRKLKHAKLKKKKAVKRRATKPREHKFIEHAKLLKHHIKRIFRI